MWNRTDELASLYDDTAEVRPELRTVPEPTPGNRAWRSRPGWPARRTRPSRGTGADWRAGQGRREWE